MISNKKYILNELSSNAEPRIKDAINNVLRVKITYNDKKPHVISSRRGYQTRYILPVAFGLTKSGKKAIRAYQTFGSTKRGVPKWKLFLLENIVSWNNGKKTFKEYKDALIKLGLNLEGDKHMTTIYAITPFANDDVEISKDDKIITPEPISKNDVTPVPSTNVTAKPSIINKPKSVSTVEPKNIDNDGENHFINKVEAPDTEPITKGDIKQDNNVDNTDNTTQNVDNNVMPSNDEIETDEPQTSDEIDQVKNNFNDMMSRMNNIYNNDDEDKKF
jgi:hypothetical protein